MRYFFLLFGLTVSFQVTALSQIDDIQLLKVKAVRSIQIYKKGSDFRSTMAIRFSNGSEKSLRFKDAEFNLSASRVLEAEDFLSNSLIYAHWAKDNATSVLVMIGDEKIGRPIDPDLLVLALEELGKEGKLDSVKESLTKVLKVIKLDYQNADKIRFQVVIPFGKATVNSLEIGSGTPVLPMVFDTTLDILIGPSDKADTTSRLVEILNIFGEPANTYSLTLVGEGEVGVKLANGWVSQKTIKVEYGFLPAIQREVLIE